MHDPFQVKSESISPFEEDGEEVPDPPPALVVPAVPHPEDTASLVRAIQRKRSRNEDADELRAYRTNSEKLAKLRTKDLQGWFSNPSVAPPQVCFSDFPCFQSSSYNYYSQQLGDLPAVFARWTDALDKIECGPNLDDPFNLRGITARDLASNCVRMIKSTSRVVIALGLGHDPSLRELQPDADLIDVLAVARGLATYTNAEFQLAGAPPDMFVDWPCWASEEEGDADGVPLAELEAALIQGERSVGASRMTRGKKRGCLKGKKRKDPWFCATRPPALSNLMFSAPENLQGTLILPLVPYLWHEQGPSGWRKWRQYAYLTPVPTFSPPDVPNLWEYRARFFR